MSTTPRRFSDKQMRRYFMQKHRFLMREITVGIIVLIATILLFYLNNPLAWIGLLLSLMLLTWITWRIRATPSDEQFDEWLRQQGQLLEMEAYDEISRGGRRKPRVTDCICIYSFLLPESTACSRYSRTVLKKLRKDNVYRFSLNFFTFFFFTGRYLGVFVYGLDALNQNHRYNRIQYFPYAHLSEIKVVESTEYAEVRGQTHLYLARNLTILAINKEITLDGHILTEPVKSDDWYAPTIELDIEERLQKLLDALLNHW